MILAYILFCFFSIWVGLFIFERKYNPISLYTVVWTIAVCMHASGLMVFNEMRPFTWIVIFFSHFLFVAGCCLGTWINRPLPIVCYECNELQTRKYMLCSIVITLSLSAIAIVGNVKTMIAHYGFDLFSQVTQIYADRVNELKRFETIPYLGSFIFIALPLLGCYTKKFGFNPVVIPAFALVCLNSLVSGGRAGIIFSMLLFLSAYFCTSGKSIGLSIGKKIALSMGLFVFSLMIVGISEQRTVGIQMSYATPLYHDLFGENIALYKGIAYVAAPIGTLNEYLGTCDFHFGENTFLTIYNIFAKFGICERIPQYQEFFSTPSSCNVATWVREIIEDFTLVGAIFFVPLFGYLSTLFYCKAISRPLMSNKIVWSVFSLVILLSFFDWKFRSSNMWIAAILGFIIGNYIDKKTFIRASDDRRLNVEL